MHKVYLLFFNRKITNVEYKFLLNLLSSREKQKIKKFKYFSDRTRSIVSNLFAKTQISYLTGIELLKVQFRYDYYGKPFLKEDEIYINFNYSHSGLWTALAISDKPIGIDIEIIRDIDFNIANQFFTLNENWSIINSNNPLEYFFELWTLKESYVKFDGRAFQIPMNKIEFSLEEQHIHFNNYFDRKENVFFKTFNNLSGYKIACCSIGNDVHKQICVWNLDTLIKYLYS